MSEELSNEQKKEVDKQVKQQLENVEKKVEAKIHKRLARNIKERTFYIGSQFRQQTATAIVAAFSFLIALVWRDFIVEVIQKNAKIASFEFYPHLAELLTAIIVTFIAIIGLMFISYWSKQEENKQVQISIS